MAKKKSYQNVCLPRVLSAAERDLYGWVDKEVFYQPSMVEADMLPELLHEMRLTANRVAERDFALEAAGPSDRLPFRALEDMTHFLWVYAELFTRLGVQLPFTSFQREVITRCRVAASQLHLNGWGFLHTDESFLTVLRSLSRSLNGTSSKFCRFLVGGPFGLTTRYHCVGSLGDLGIRVSSIPFGWVREKSKFKCRWILDHSDVEVGVFLDSLLGDMEKQSRFDRLWAKITEVEGAGPRSILPIPPIPTASTGASGSTPATRTPSGPSSGAAKPKKKPPAAYSNKPISLEKEEGAKEDPSADLRQKRQKRKVQESFPKEAASGADSAWKQEVIENVFSAKVKIEKELAATKDQVDVLTAERDSTFPSPLLKVKVDSLTEQLRLAEGERLSALACMSEVEEGSKVQAVELQSCCSALEQERKKVESLTQSLEQKQTAFGEAEGVAGHWRQEWKALVEEIGEMVQETFEILMDQVRHINPAMDYSMITLDTRWDPNGKRIYNPKAEIKEQTKPAVEDQSGPAAEAVRALGGAPIGGGSCGRR
ncbi:hypothetical protein PIB30_053425 [Stylosanthes scabra]|uniref:Uncharacterized protein n=1 Tax=Stylosanthes scabra TaxID=79078 RepID=A0ABU6ZHB8_9FABA|nr:hypothetical protein [Stylosanthes scabra]